MDDIYMAMWDDLHAQHGQMKLDEARDAWIASYVEAVESGRIPRKAATLADEGKRMFEAVVRPGREKRRRSFARNLEYLVDSILNPEEGASLDPIMDQAFPVGDGTDKPLFHWTPDDFRTAVTVRYRGAAEQTAAAAEFDAVVQRVLDVMGARGVQRTGDLAVAA